MHPVTVRKQQYGVGLCDIIALKNKVEQSVRIMMVIQRVKPILDKKGREMCFIEGYDDTGSLEGVVFSTVYMRIKHILQRNAICVLTGKIKHKDTMSIIIQDAKTVQEG